MRQVLNPIPQNVIDGRSMPNSAGIRTEQFIFVRGMLGQDYRTRQLASEDIRGQTRQAIENIRTVLKAGGSSLDKVVMVFVQLARREDFAGFNEVYALHFPTEPPARTAMLAGILREGALVEITAIAIA